MEAARSAYAAGAAGRTFPSAAGFHTAELFFTDDSGIYLFPTRDAGALVDPAEEPYLEGHNTWCVNVPGSLLVIPVADIAQHLLAILCFFTQNGYAIYDDVNRRQIPGLEFYDRFFKPGAYLETHAAHMPRWHDGSEEA